MAIMDGDSAGSRLTITELFWIIVLHDTRDYNLSIVAGWLILLVWDSVRCIILSRIAGNSSLSFQVSSNNDDT